jgi:branched-chain amino acid transport system substrate-binding protein
VFAQAVEKAGTIDLDALIGTLRNKQFETVLGRIGFDEKGDVTAPGYVFYAWKNGTYDYVN